jgi:hypothetical protein
MYAIPALERVEKMRDIARAGDARAAQEGAKE